MNKETRLQEINKEISELKKQLKNVKGTDTEIYTRIVGYYRPLKQWNDGQQSQYRNRKLFQVKSHEKN